MFIFFLYRNYVHTWILMRIKNKLCLFSFYVHTGIWILKTIITGMFIYFSIVHAWVSIWILKKLGMFNFFLSRNCVYTWILNSCICPFAFSRYCIHLTFYVKSSMQLLLFNYGFWILSLIYKNSYAYFLSSDQLESLRQASLARVLCDNTDQLVTLQRYPMVLVDHVMWAAAVRAFVSVCNRCCYLKPFVLLMIMSVNIYTQSGC